jgi:lipoyl synthase
MDVSPPTAPHPVARAGPYRDALALQHGLHESLGARSPAPAGAPAHLHAGRPLGSEPTCWSTRQDGGGRSRLHRPGGDVTYHGPGHLVGYPILHLPGKGGGDKPDTAAYVFTVEQFIIDVLADLGLVAGRLHGYPGVWVDHLTMAPRKVCAIGVKVAKGKSLHGFGLNVDPDMSMFGHIVPCGIADKAVTSLRAEGVDASMAEVVDAVAARASERWGSGGVDRHDVVWRHRDADLAPFSRGEGPGEVPRPGTSVRLQGRLAAAGVGDGIAITERKPEWMRAKADFGPGYLEVKRTMRELDLVTVCEEAGCPNISECWNDGTATFMICGERCTRACGFCLVDTRHPEPLDPGEPERVALAVERMGLRYAVLTTVARDDLADGGASQFAATIAAIRARTPGVAVECLISDCKGDPRSLEMIFEARPEVLNHNIETVARLQRAVRPSAGYARSLGVLAQAKAAGLTTKSSIIVGMGETLEEVEATLVDLRGVGVDIVTIGQYLRPTTNHLPVARWVTPDEFAHLANHGEALGIGHVESGPLTRSSYHARQAAETAVAVAAAEVERVVTARQPVVPDEVR